MTAHIRHLLAAVMFLTRIPVPARAAHPSGHVPSDDLARSTTYFPLVGLLVGAWGGAVYAASAAIFAPPLAAVLAVAATALLTGAFHEDALADAADGFGGGWSAEQVLSIMKDSRVGSYGALALVLVVLARVAALGVIAGQAGSVGPVVRALVAGHVLGRWSSLPLILRYPYVREAGASGAPADRATGKPFAGSVTPARLAAGTAMMLAIVIPAAGPRAPAVLAVGLALTLLAGRYFRRRIGGITGDCLGAANQLVELSTYLVLAASLR